MEISKVVQEFKDKTPKLCENGQSIILDTQTAVFIFDDGSAVLMDTTRTFYPLTREALVTLRGTKQ